MALTQIGTITLRNSPDSMGMSSCGVAVSNTTEFRLNMIYASYDSSGSSAGTTSLSAGSTVVQNNAYYYVITHYNNKITNNFVPICFGFVKYMESNFVMYMNSEGVYIKVILTNDDSVEVPLFSLPASGGVSSINLSTVEPNTTIEVLVDGANREVNNTPKTVDITDGNIIINVSTHSPKDNYTVQVNNGNNMFNITDGSTQYNSFPASIHVGENKTITAYGEPDKEITIKYTNTGTPVITNT